MNRLTASIRRAVAALAAALAVLMAALLSACGGGSGADAPPAPTPITLAVYGDSAASGLGLAVRPVPDLARRLGVRAIDYTMPGTTLGQVTLRDDDGAHIILLRHGGAHAAHHGLQGLDEFDRQVTAFIAAGRATGAQVVLTGLISFAPAPWLPDADNARILAMLDAYDARLQAIAARTGAPFINLRAVPFAGRADLIDDVHPGADYSARLTAHIAAVLAPLLPAARP